MNERLNLDAIPNHIALVMDGNGRWAERRGMKRTEGHAA
ncbi:MAG: undecaprenyl diphosphate synthase, partial [Candidatus Poriferisodalaceae bacterium]